MSTTPFEERTHGPLVYARGSERVLLNGLGLGMALDMVLEMDSVKSVTVIELSPDVIKLAGPTFLEDPRVEIIQADALEWQPPRGVRYGFVWHDIWTYVTEDNVPEITKLKKKYARRCERQAAWCETQARMGR
jgi:predicted membrane-bound spermidine synthase